MRSLNKTIINSAENVFLCCCHGSEMYDVLALHLAKKDRVWLIKGSQCTSRSAIFKTFSEAFSYPCLKHKNWDAFMDCLGGNKNAGMWYNKFIVIDNAGMIGKLNPEDRNAFLVGFDAIATSFPAQEDDEKQRSKAKEYRFKTILCCFPGDLALLESSLNESDIRYRVLFLHLC